MATFHTCENITMYMNRTGVYYVLMQRGYLGFTKFTAIRQHLTGSYHVIMSFLYIKKYNFHIKNILIKLMSSIKFEE